MSELTATELVRKRPGMYVGGTDGHAVRHLILDVLANAYDHYLVGRCTRIAVTIAVDGTITVEDDGPGIRDDLPLDTLLTRLSTRPTVDGHRPHVHLGHGGIGLFVVNALSEWFSLVSVRDGVETRTRYTRGTLVEPVTRTPSSQPSGTTIAFRPDPTMFPHVRAPRTELTRTFEDLAFLSPGLRLRWTIEGDELAERGLIARVALEVPCALSEVAHVRETYETAKGPVEVEVALAWRTAEAAPVIHSFVNLARTPGEGSHVDGLLAGLGDRRGGLVAAVSVILADVIYGNPTKDRLDSPEVREPVRLATVQAMRRHA